MALQLTVPVLAYWGGPWCGLNVELRCTYAHGIWLSGGVYRFSPARGAYVWREIGR